MTLLGWTVEIVDRRIPFAAAVCAFMVVFTDPAPPARAESEFIRGDSNWDSKADISDPIYTLLHLFHDFQGGFRCMDSADANDDGKVDIADSIYLLGFLFRAGPQPKLPFPAPGVDPTADSLDCPEQPPTDPIPEGIVDIRTSDWNILDGACLSIPRYKIWMNPANRGELWACFGSASGPDTFRSRDFGKTWQAIGENGWDYHVCMVGDDLNHLHFGSQDSVSHRAMYRRYDGSWGPQVSFDDYQGGDSNANVIAKGSDVWVFVRSGNEAPYRPERIYYHRSQDRGGTFGPGVPVADASSGTWKRIGSCLIDDEPALALWEQEVSACNFRIFRWNGDVFEPLGNNRLETASSDPATRNFGVCQDGDGRIHCVWWDVVLGSSVLRHASRLPDSAWTEPVTLHTFGAGGGLTFTLSRRGSSIYCVHQEHNGTYMALQFRSWTPAAGWSSGVEISGRLVGPNAHPCSIQDLDPAASYLPVIWNEGDSPRSVRYRAVPLPAP